MADREDGERASHARSSSLRTHRAARHRWLFAGAVVALQACGGAADVETGSPSGKRPPGPRPAAEFVANCRDYLRTEAASNACWTRMDHYVRGDVRSQRLPNPPSYGTCVEVTGNLYEGKFVDRNGRAIQDRVLVKTVVDWADEHPEELEYIDVTLAGDTFKSPKRRD